MFEVLINGKPSKIENIDDDLMGVNTKEYIKMAVDNYLKDLFLRDAYETQKRIKGINSKKKLDSYMLRIPESRFQNTLLKLIHNNKKINIEDLSRFIKVNLAKNTKGIIIQEQVDTILKGVMSCNEAIVSLQSRLESEYKNSKIWFGTNNNLDAEYKIDFLAVVQNNNSEDDSVNALYLGQVKSSDFHDSINKNEITQTHQDYINSLPHFIDNLNKKIQINDKEESDIIDINRDIRNEEQLTLFELVLEKYISDINDTQNANASDFYELYKKEGGIFNPFDVIKILKNLNSINNTANTNLNINNEKVKKLINTIDSIPFTQAEHVTFNKQTTIHTLLDIPKIISIIMVKGDIKLESQLNTLLQSPLLKK